MIYKHGYVLPYFTAIVLSSSTVVWVTLMHTVSIKGRKMCTKTLD